MSLSPSPALPRRAGKGALGLNVLRIKAETVDENLPVALDMIRSKIAKLKTSEFPSPILGEAEGERAN